jgi:hypothetical protein
MEHARAEAEKKRRRSGEEAEKKRRRSGEEADRRTLVGDHVTSNQRVVYNFLMRMPRLFISG